MLGINAALDSILHCVRSSSFLFLRICQYDIFLVWFDFSVFGSVYNPLQVVVKDTEQDVALTHGKVARANIITTFKLFN